MSAPKADTNQSSAESIAATVTCTELAKLTASDTTGGHYYGADVSVSGSTVVVGAPGTPVREPGAVRVYKCEDSCCTSSDDEARRAHLLRTRQHDGHPTYHL